MTSEQIELLRLAVLRQLNTTRIAMSLQVICMGVKIAGFKLPETEVERELEYLCEKNWVKPVRSEISKGVRNYKITSTGTEYLEEQGY
jgi:hypothetical protein